MWILREGLIKTGLPKSLVKRAAKCETGTNIFGIDNNLKWPFGGQTSQAKHSLIVEKRNRSGVYRDNQNPYIQGLGII